MKACTCGHAQEEHGHDPQYPGSTSCQECGCIAYEAGEDIEDDEDDNGEPDFDPDFDEDDFEEPEFDPDLDENNGP